MMSDELCLNCGRTLYFDAELLLWRCKNPDCRRIYTYRDLHGEHLPDVIAEGRESKGPERSRRDAFLFLLAVLVVGAAISVPLVLFGSSHGNEGSKSEALTVTSPIVTPITTFKTSSTPSPTPPPRQNCVNSVCTYYGKQPPYARTSLSQATIQLVRNPNATDPTWQQLKSFLLTDNTDEETYNALIFPCGAFAEELQNHAEAAGIKAAWVGIDFADGGASHALDAFNTTDEGLVYVDCTGKDLTAIRIVPFGSKTYGDINNWDKVAYLTIGKEYGLVSLDVATCPEYSCYEAYEQKKADFDAKLQQYNQEVEAYNSDADAYSIWITGKVFYVGTAEDERAQQWYADLQKQKQHLDAESQALDTEGNALGGFWQPLGIVSHIEIYW